MEALILTSALLALARLLTKKPARDESSSTSEPTTPPAIVRDPPPPPPPPPPPAWRPPDGIADRARLERARGLALQVAQLIKAHGPAYNRNFVAAFQREAGLEPDGIYGPRTAGAVKWYTGESIPPLSGRGFEPYAPFGSVKAVAPKASVTKPVEATPPMASQKQPATTQTLPPQKPVPPPPSQKPVPPPTIAPPQKPATATPAKEPPPAPKTPTPVKPVTAAPEKSEEPSAERPAIAPATPTVPALPDRARLDRAAALAKQVGESVKKTGKAYDRALVTAFQKEAGLAVDGVYGPRTAGAVKWYTDESIPPPTGGALVPYVPKLDTTAPVKAEPKRIEPKPDAHTTKPAQASPEVTRPAAEHAAPVVRDRARLDRAAELAKRVALNLKEPAKAYNRALVTEFQREAGLTPDGVYGARSAGAIKWYTGEAISPKTGRGFVQYAPNF